MFDTINNKPDKQLLRSLLYKELATRLSVNWRKGGKTNSSPQELAEKLLVSWFDPLQILHTEEGVQVSFPHPFFANWFSEQGKAVFEQIIAQNFGENTKIDYLNTASSFSIPKPAIKLDNTPNKVSVQTQTKINTQSQHPTDNYYFSTKRYSTRNFLYSPKNQLIDHVLKWSIKDGLSYNPILILGPSATGKSHLLQNIAAKLEEDSELPVLFLSAGELNNAFENWKKSSLSFNRLAMENSAFCLDDVHLLASNQATQQNLILLFNLLITYHKTIVCTALANSANSQSIIKAALIPTLFSRLGMGLVINLREPDLDLRFKFAQDLFIEKMIQTSRDFCLQISRKCSNFRVLQGAVLRISAFHAHTGQLPEGSDLDNIFSSSGDPTSLTSAQIINVVANRCGFSSKDLLGRKRDSKLVQARQIAMYLCRELLGESYPALGKAFGGKDHSTVIHDVKKIEKNLDTNKDLHKLVTELTNTFRQNLI